MKEYPVTIVIQETNRDPYDSDSESIYRGVVKCKTLDIAYALTDSHDDPEEVMALINEYLRRVDTLAQIGSKIESAILAHERDFRHKSQ